MIGACDGIGDMNIAAGRVRMLTDMLEPGPCRVALEAGELAARHDLDGPHLRHRDRQQQVRAAARAWPELALPCSRRAMSNTNRHSSVTWRGIR